MSRASTTAPSSSITMGSSSPGIAAPPARGNPLVARRALVREDARRPLAGEGALALDVGVLPRAVAHRPGPLHVVGGARRAGGGHPEAAALALPPLDTLGNHEGPGHPARAERLAAVGRADLVPRRS